MTSVSGMIDNFLLAAGFSLLIGSMLFPAILRNVIAVFVNALISPFSSRMPFYAVLLAMAVIVATVSALVQKYKVDSTLARRVGERDRAIQKELREAQLSRNKNKLKKLEEERLLLLQDKSKLSVQQLKSMGYTVLVSIPSLMWANWYVGTHASSVMSLPVLGNVALTGSFFIVPYWFLWFTVCSIIAGYVIRRAIIGTA